MSHVGIVVWFSGTCCFSHPRRHNARHGSLLLGGAGGGAGRRQGRRGRRGHGGEALDEPDGAVDVGEDFELLVVVARLWAQHGTAQHRAATVSGTYLSSG